jgi:hypothetical protein
MNIRAKQSDLTAARFLINLEFAASTGVKKISGNSRGAGAGLAFHLLPILFP